MSALLVLGTCLLDRTTSDLHPAIALATTAHSFHVWELCTSRPLHYRVDRVTADGAFRGTREQKPSLFKSIYDVGPLESQYISM